MLIDIKQSFKRALTKLKEEFQIVLCMFLGNLHWISDIPIILFLSQKG